MSLCKGANFAFFKHEPGEGMVRFAVNCLSKCPGSSAMELGIEESILSKRAITQWFNEFPQMRKHVNADQAKIVQTVQIPNSLSTCRTSDQHLQLLLQPSRVEEMSLCKVLILRSSNMSLAKVWSDLQTSLRKVV